MFDRSLKLLLVALIAVFLLQTARQGFDLSLAFSFIAIYIAVSELRANSTTLVRLRKCTCSGIQSAGENNDKFFHEFQIIVENRGVALLDARMSLGLADPSGHGWFSIPLIEFKELHGTHQRLERGMVAVFGWRSYKLDAHEIATLSALRDARTQKAVLTVYSQSYRAYQFRVGNWLDRAKFQWNQFAYWVNRRFQREFVSPDGSRMLKSFDILPTLNVLEFQLMNFIQGVNKPVPTTV